MSLREAIGLLHRTHLVNTGASRQLEATAPDVRDFLALHGEAT
jgi:hypothetical protein